MVVDGRLPRDLTGLPAKGYQLGIESRHHDDVAGNGNPAIGRPAANLEVVRQRMIVAPVQGASRGIKRQQPVPSGGEIQNAVVDHRRRLELPRHPGLRHPGQLQVTDRVGRQTRNRAVPPAGIVAAEVQPCGRVGRRVPQRLIVNGTVAATDVGVGGPVIPIGTLGVKGGGCGQPERGDHQNHRRRTTKDG